MNKNIKTPLLIALFLMPAAATLLHTKVHGDIWWLTYVTLFDAIVITFLMARKQTVEYGFYLNALFALSGLYHFFMKTDAGITTAIMAGLTDVMFVAVDFLIGLVLFQIARKESAPETQQ